MTKIIDPATWDAALRLLAPIVSHEIRNPLAIIGNSSYFIKVKLGKGAETDPKILKHLGIIEEELAHANATLGEILAFARMHEPALQAHPLNALVETAVRDLKPEPGVGLKLSLGKDAPRVTADGELASTAIRHVVRNALQAVAGGRDTPAQVSVGTSAKGSFGEIEVSDDGPGVPVEALPRLFEPFNTTKPRGIGLGLAYVQKVLLLHKGSIELVEGTDPGATFRIRLPLAG